jgi:hypothetical protein
MREVGRTGRAADDHVARPVARERDPGHLVVPLAAQVRRPLETGVDHERVARVTARHTEAVALAAQESESAGDGAAAPVRQRLPGNRRLLTQQGAGSGADEERAGGVELERFRSRDADDDASEVGVRRQQQVVLERAGALADPGVDAFVKPVVAKARVGTDVRLPARWVVSEEVVVDARPPALAHDRRLSRRVLERQRK